MGDEEQTTRTPWWRTWRALAAGVVAVVGGITAVLGLLEKLPSIEPSVQWVVCRFQESERCEPSREEITAAIERGDISQRQETRFLTLALRHLHYDDANEATPKAREALSYFIHSEDGDVRAAAAGILKETREDALWMLQRKLVASTIIDDDAVADGHLVALWANNSPTDDLLNLLRRNTNGTSAALVDYPDGNVLEGRPFQIQLLSQTGGRLLLLDRSSGKLRVLLPRSAADCPGQVCALTIEPNTLTVIGTADGPGHVAIVPTMETEEPTEAGELVIIVAPPLVGDSFAQLITRSGNSDVTTPSFRQLHLMAQSLRQQAEEDGGLEGWAMTTVPYRVFPSLDQ